MRCSIPVKIDHNCIGIGFLFDRYQVLHPSCLYQLFLPV